jgi:hypothetical protein
MQNDCLLVDPTEAWDDFVCLDQYGNEIHNFYHEWLADKENDPPPTPCSSPPPSKKENLPLPVPDESLMRLTPMSKKAKYQQKCRDTLNKRREQKQSTSKSCN